MMKRLLSVLLVVVLALVSLSVVAAQETDAQETVSPVRVTQTATGGTLTQGEGKFFTLVLNGVQAIVPYAQVNNPELGGVLSAPGFFEMWGLVGQANVASFTVNKVTVTLSLSAPVYDSKAKTTTYTAEVLSVKGAEAAPSEFGRVSLYINGSAVFVESMRSLSDNISVNCTYDCDDAP